MRKIRVLWLLVMIVVTPVIALPWNTIGKTIAQQQEDDDSGADDGEMAAASANCMQQGRSPRLPPPTLPIEQLQAPLFAVRLVEPPTLAVLKSAPQSTRVRLQI